MQHLSKTISRRQLLRSITGCVVALTGCTSLPPNSPPTIRLGYIRIVSTSLQRHQVHIIIRADGTIIEDSWYTVNAHTNNGGVVADGVTVDIGAWKDKTANFEITAELAGGTEREVLKPAKKTTTDCMKIEVRVYEKNGLAILSSPGCN